jgi:Bacterial Ig-like domain
MSGTNSFNSNQDPLSQLYGTLLRKSSKTTSPLEEPFGTTKNLSSINSDINPLVTEPSKKIHTGNSQFALAVYKIFWNKDITYVNIGSISDDTDVKYDYKTTDNTLIFKGSAEADNSVEVFLKDLDSGKQFSLGATTANKSQEWTLDYRANLLPDGEYELRVETIDLKGNTDYAQLPESLYIDNNKDYDIKPDFTDASIQNNIPLQSRIKEAADYWKGIIKNDIPDVNGSHGYIDDLEIKFVVSNLDGLGGGLANTGGYDFRGGYSGINDYDPTTGKLLPNSSFLPSYAVITIDSADVNDILTTDYGLDTLKHEIAHAIGFNAGTFAQKGLIDEFTYNPYVIPIINQYETYRGFKGENAVKVYHELGGNPLHKSVPLDENSPGHWHEWLFPDQSEMDFIVWSPFDTDELMTTNPPIDKNDKVYLSKLTLAAFTDLGFTVDWNKADNIKVNSGTFGNPIVSIPYGNPSWV